MESKPYDVVLVPEVFLADRAIELSKHLEVKGSYFALGKETFYPHLSLYMLQLNKVGLTDVRERMANLANSTELVQARSTHYHYSHDYLDVEYEKSSELNVLQQKIIKALNPLRTGLRENDKARLTTSTEEEHSNILEYGYRSVGNLFKPHLTFTRFTGDQESILPSLPPKETFDGVYDSLGIYELGENGTCIHLVETWNLQSIKI